MQEQAEAIYARSDAYRTLDASFALDCQVALRCGWTYNERLRHGLSAWFSPEGKQYARPPRYSYDLNLTWAAALTLGCGISIYTYNHSERGVFVALDNLEGAVGSDGNRIRPAVALCRAICMWVDRKDILKAALP